MSTPTLFRRSAWLVLLPLAVVLPAGAADKPDELAAALRRLDAKVLPGKADAFAAMLADDARARRDAANRRETLAWQEVKTQADWERYRDARLRALCASLGQFPPTPGDLRVRVTGRLRGDGYQVENLVFESRPGLWVTANLYLPAEPPRSMPGILLCHSHHNPKTQGEFQDMGMTWARLGCAVLVMDQLGHGERRQHPFRDAKDYPQPFAVGRQDYYFRYNVGVQLHLVGDSLIGWMAWDLMRGVDLLLARPGVDRERIILLGAVAGGGDPAAVAATLDPRIAAVVPFNFGGPQPETAYPLPADADKTFNYAGGGSWESTRNLRLSARDGFLPWVIVAAAAPRRLVYGHEFSWDRERDPVWARLEKVYGFYGAGDRLGFTHGRGLLTGKEPESTHCNNIGPEHRKLIYPALKRWFDIPAPGQEARDRRKAEDLLCLTPEAAKEINPRPLHQLAAELGTARAEAARRRLADLGLEAGRQRLRQDWSRLLGDIEPRGAPKVTVHGTDKIGDVTLERVTLEVEPRIIVPMLLLRPNRPKDERLPVVVAFAQEGKQVFLKERAEALSVLLTGGVAVCLPDLRGTGETRSGDGGGRRSAATSVSSTELMLGQTLVGSQLRDLRSVLKYLRDRPEIDPARVSLWGESFAPVNPDGRRLDVPLDAEKLPDQSEPQGALLAMLGALFDDRVRAVAARGGLVGYQTVLEAPFLYLPYDAVIPGALTAGDVCDLAAALAPRPLRLEGLVDGLNRRAHGDQLAKALAPTQKAYAREKAADRLHLAERPSQDGDLARWLLDRFKDK